MVEDLTHIIQIGFIMLIPCFQLFNKVKLLLYPPLTKHFFIFFLLVFSIGSLAAYFNVISTDSWIFSATPLFQFIWVSLCYKLFVHLSGSEPIDVVYNFQKGLLVHRVYAFVTLFFSILMPVAFLVVFDYVT